MKLGLGLGLSGFASSSFDPLSIANSRLWLRSDLGVTESGGAVSSWADQSGAGDSNRNATQGTAANKPTFISADSNFNSKPTISFDGTDDYLVTGTWTGGSYAQPVTIYTAFRHTVDGGYVFDDIDGTSRIALTSGTTGGSSFFFAGATVNTNTAQSTTLIVGIVYNGASSAAYVNNSQSSASSGDPGANALKSMTIGARFSVTTFLTGNIAEILAYSGAHDATTRQKVMQYMGGRYGVSVV